MGRILSNRAKNRRMTRAGSFHPAAAGIFSILFFAGGMAGGSCTNPIPMSIVGSPVGNPIAGRLPVIGPKIVSSDHILGRPDAPVTLVEYSDMECPVCGRFARNELPDLIQNFVNTGKIRFVFRHFPSTTRNRAEPAAMAAECAADQGFFFEYHDLLFADQSDLSDAHLRSLAEDLGLDLATFDACVAANSKRIRVQQDVTSATALGVSTTPAFFIEGDLVTGFQTANDLGDMILRKINDIDGQ